MKKILLLSFLVTYLIGCDDTVQLQKIQGASRIQTTIATIEPQTIVGKIQAYGRLESAEEVTLNVDFAAPVEKILVDEGDEIKKGQLLIQLNNQKLKLAVSQATNQLQQAQAAHNNNQASLERLKQLALSDQLSQQTLDNAKTELLASSAQVQSLHSQILLLKQDVLHSQVISPIDGWVSKKHLTDGQAMAPFQPLLTLQATSSIKASVFVSEKSLALLKINNHALVKTVAGDYSSQIYSIGAKGDPHTGNFEVKLIIDNQNSHLKPGMTTEVMLDTRPLSNQLIIPQAALSTFQGQHVVYRLQDDHAQRTAVDITFGFNDQLYIEQGINAGDKIIISASQHVTDQSPITIIKGASDE